MDENKNEEPQLVSSFANQTNQDVQPQPTQPLQTISNQPPMQEPVIDTPQPTPEVQQTILATPEANVAGQTTVGRESKLKYIAYFFLGLILSILGLLIGSLWIVVKEKQNRLRKSIPLLLGVISSIIFWWWVVGGIAFDRTTTSMINTSQPKGAVEREIVTDLSNLYPNLSFKVLYGEHNPPRTFGNTTISTFVTVELSSDGNVTPEQIAEVGKQVCSTLTRFKLSVSQVQVETVNAKAVFSSLQGIGGTCEEYNSGEILNTLQSAQQ